MEIMAVKKWRKRSGFVLYLYFNDSAFTAVRVVSDFRMTLKNGFGKCSLFVLSANG